MPKYYCDYCDTYLTHDSPSVRRTHNQGRNHKENVRKYYQDWLEEQAQKLIDQTTAAFKSGKLPLGAARAALNNSLIRPALPMTSPFFMTGPPPPPMMPPPMQIANPLLTAAPNPFFPPPMPPASAFFPPPPQGMQQFMVPPPDVATQPMMFPFPPPPHPPALMPFNTAHMPPSTQNDSSDSRQC